MSKHIKKFETEQAFDQWRQSQDCELPQLSWCVTENAIKSEALITPPPHDYVEIGGIKWATMNIGATAVTDSGLYFQWGDTQGYTEEQCGSGDGQKYFAWEDYKYSDGIYSYDIPGMTKYNHKDRKNILEPEDDAAHVNWGDNWRMPTVEEFRALRDAVSKEWTSSYEGSGVAGTICTDKSDSSKMLFFPALGYCANGTVHNVGNAGYYWCSSLDSGDRYQSGWKAEIITGIDSEIPYLRRTGLTVRGVLGE